MSNLQTPYFVIDEKELTKNINDFHKALKKYWHNYIIGYSVKTNSLPWILKHVLNNNCYAEVVSSPEYKLAVSMGYNKDKIIFNGPAKGKEEFVDAIENRSIVNLDSKREVEWIQELGHDVDLNIKVGIRVNIDLEKYCPGEIGYEEEGTRFGFSLENGDLYGVIETLKTIPNVSIVGIHLHQTSITRSLSIYKELAKKACEIKRATNIDFKFVDIGGGFFGGLPDKPTFAEYAEVISKELREEYHPEDTCLIVEPGSAIIGSPVSFITEVVDVKDTAKSRVVTLDGSRINIDPLWRKTSYFYDIESNTTNTVETQLVCGFTCMDTDRMMKIHNQKELSIGDKIIFKHVGAYTMSLSPLFIEYFPSVYVRKEDTYECVREKWDIAEYMQKTIYE